MSLGGLSLVVVDGLLAALVGVGYIVGLQISLLVFAGGALSWVVAAPLMTMAGSLLAVMALLSYTLASIAAWWLGKSREPAGDTQPDAATL